MAKFGESLERLQQSPPQLKHEPTTEEIARETYRRQQAVHRAEFNKPVNVRYREILGMMATKLTEHGAQLDPHRVKIGTSYYQYDEYAIGSWTESPQPLETYGWSLKMKPHYSDEDMPPTYNGDVNHPYFRYLFLKNDRAVASRKDSTLLVAADNPQVGAGAIVRHPIVEYKGKLHVVYSGGLTDVLTMNDDLSLYNQRYEIHNDELLCTFEKVGQKYQFSVEENLAALLASKLAE